MGLYWPHRLSAEYFIFFCFEVYRKIEVKYSCKYLKVEILYAVPYVTLIHLISELLCHPVENFKRTLWSGSVCFPCRLTQTQVSVKFKTKCNTWVLFTHFVSKLCAITRCPYFAGISALSLPGCTRCSTQVSRSRQRTRISGRPC